MPGTRQKNGRLVKRRRRRTREEGRIRVYIKPQTTTRHSCVRRTREDREDTPFSALQLHLATHVLEKERQTGEIMESKLVRGKALRRKGDAMAALQYEWDDITMAGGEWGGNA